MKDLIPLIVFVLIVLANFLKRALQSDDGGSSAKPPRDSEMERDRRFREALGLPTGAPPPGRVMPRKSAGPPPPLLPVKPRPPFLTPPLFQPGQLRRVQPEPAREAPPEHRVVLQVPTPVLYVPSPPPAEEAPAPVPAQTPPGARAPNAQAERAYRQNREAGTVEGASRATPRAAAILALLRVHGSARKAMVIREVLGRPKALPAFQIF